MQHSRCARSQLTRPKICTSFMLTLLLFTLTPTKCIEETLREQCPNLIENTDCQCIRSFSEDFEVNCAATDPIPRITVKIRHLRHVQIECNHIGAEGYKLLPAIKIGNYSMVQIKNCPLPGHAPIANIFKHLGIANVNSLLFESSDLGANLTPNHLSGLNGLGRLRFSSNGLSRIPENLFMNLTNLTWLDLRSNIIELPANIFENVTNLSYLELGHNNFQHLPAGIFRNQRKLIHLNLWSNKLRNLTKDVFEGATSVTDLDLSSNGIETFEPDVFSLLTNLSNINLNANHFRELPAGLFANNKNLTIVRMVNNRVQLVKLPPALFADLPQLKEVRITCDMKEIPDDLFANSTNISNMSLANNELETLPANLFSGLSNLYDIDLRRNKLKSLDSNLFRDTINLVILKLSNNQLEDISNDVFSSLLNLDTLYLDNNRLMTIGSTAFAQTQNIRHLYMQNNRLSLSGPVNNDTDEYFRFELLSPFQTLGRLRTLNLRNNTLIYIFRDWRHNLVELEELDLSFNNITSIDFTDFEFLSINELSVDLRHNKIGIINFTGMDLIAAERSKILKLKVNLNNNPVQCDCILLWFVQFLRNQRELKNIQLNLITDQLTCSKPDNLKDKQVAEVEPKSLLCSYDMEGASQQLCPRGCSCWVRTLDFVLLVNCSNANFMKVPRLPPLTEKLHSIELHVENNQLRQLPTTSMFEYAKVKQIYAAGNNLTNIDIENLPDELALIDLSHNKLNALNESVIKFMNSSRYLDKISLSGNPWSCDCEDAPLVQFVQKRYKMISDFDQMRCAQPHSSKQIKQLVYNDICPESQGIYIALAVTISLAGFLLGLILALYYKYNTEIKVWMYKYNLCAWLVNEEELDKDKKYDAFISYSHKDEEFIAKYLVPELEHGPIRFKLCVHVRDFIVGECIPDQIIRSVDDSRRTIVVLSQNFIESVWARMEFRAAHQAALNEGRARLIVIIYSDIHDIESLDSDLQAYLKMNTYLKWGDPWFWDKLRYAMPHPSRKSHGFIKNPLKSSVDDKLELIKPSPVTPPLTTPPSEATKNPLIAHLNGGKTPQTSVIIPNGKTVANGGGIVTPPYYSNGKIQQNGHFNGAFIINTNAKQSDV